MKRGTPHKMINTLWNLWTATEVIASVTASPEALRERM